jgi:hypothetical protein
VTFRDWLLTEASQDIRRLQKLGWTVRDAAQRAD